MKSLLPRGLFLAVLAFASAFGCLQNIPLLVTTYFITRPLIDPLEA